MSDKLRVIRDSIDTGDDVLVVHHGRKPRQARVHEVLRSALRVRYIDNPALAHTVLLKDVRRVEEEEVVTKAPLPQRASRVQVKPVAAAVIEPEKPTNAIVVAAVTTPEPTPEAENEEMGAWLEMGKEVRTRIFEELKATGEQIAVLRDDVHVLNLEIERLERLEQVLDARWERVNAVLT